MKKIAISLAVVALVAAGVVMSTSSLFSDTETSTGNTFTAGGIDLTVDSQCSYNGNQSSECGTWELKNLNPTADKFFNFADIKPGDTGENTVSLHVYNNDAYGCFYVSPLANDENTCTEPEQVAEDNQCVAGAGNGELAQNIEFFAWDDVNGNNVWDLGEQPLFTNIKGPASDVLNGQTYSLGTLTAETQAAANTKYLGLQWCAGTLTVTPGVDQTPNSITCDGNSMGNNTQTDSMSASVAFYVEQVKNNENFSCAAHNPFVKQ